MLAGGRLRCPDCGGVLARWGYAAARFVRVGAVREGFAGLERLVSGAGGDDMDRLVPGGGPVADAVAQIGACVAALRRGRGGAVLTVSAAQVVAVLSGGWLLGRRGLRVAGL